MSELFECVSVSWWVSDSVSALLSESVVNEWAIEVVSDRGSESVSD